MAQTLSQTRKSGTPNTPSSLAKTTSISDSHTVNTSTPSISSTTDRPKVPASPTLPKQERPRTQHRGSDLEPADRETIREMERKNSIAEVSDEDEDEDEEDEDEEDEKVKDVKEETVKKGDVGATDKEEKKVMGGKMTQEQGAKDGESAGVSVGD